MDGVTTPEETGYRIERDSMGEVEVPADALWRAQTQRAVENFPISGTPIERVGGTFLSDGRVRYAWFMSTHGAPFATSWALEYDPEGTRAPGPAGMVTLTPVEGEQDWWFACCAD